MEQANCQHDWRDSYSIGVAGVLLQALECEKCGLRTHQKEGVETLPPRNISVNPPPDDD